MPKRYNGLNPAYLTIYSDYLHDLDFWSQSTECYECPFVLKKINGKLTTLDMNTVYSTNFTVNTTKITNEYITHLFREKSNCSLKIDKNGQFDSKLECDDGVDIYLPIAGCLLVYLLIGIIWFIGKYFYKRYTSHNDAQLLIASDLGNVEDESPNPHHGTGSIDSNVNLLPVNRSRSRLKSLDTFRGLSLVLMIFVNYGGGMYYFFTHSPWNGLTVADLVFPWFIWIMGVSMVLSFHSMLRHAVPKWRILLKIIRRVVILFFLGLIINGKDKYQFETFRIFGVLQRIALCYLIVGCCDILFTRPNDAHLHLGNERPWWSRIRDIVFSWPQWICAISLIVIHTCLTFLLRVKDCPTGYLGPGGLNNELHPNCTGGAAGYIDKMILGYNHMYEKPTCKTLYDTHVPYDPEGILGTLTASFLVFLGLQAGKILVFYDNHQSRIIRWLVWGTALIGLILCYGKQNEGPIPINKNLWSLSFVFVMSGMSFYLLSFLYWIIDWYRVWDGGPFRYAGMNSILIFVGHEFTTGVFPWGWPCPPDHLCYLAKAAWGTTLWVLISIYLYYKQFFLII